MDDTARSGPGAPRRDLFSLRDSPAIGLPGFLGGVPAFRIRTGDAGSESDGMLDEYTDDIEDDEHGSASAISREKDIGSGPSGEETRDWRLSAFRQIGTWLDANRGEGKGGRYRPKDDAGAEEDGGEEEEDEYDLLDEGNFWRSYVPEGAEAWNGSPQDKGEASPDAAAASSSGGAGVDEEDATSTHEEYKEAANGPGDIPRDSLDPRDAVHDDDEDEPVPPSLPDEAARADRGLLEILMEEIEVLLDEQAGELEPDDEGSHEGGRYRYEGCGCKHDIFADHPGGRYVFDGGLTGEMADRMRSIYRFLADRLGGEIIEIIARLSSLKNGGVKDVERALQDLTHRIEDVEALIAALDGLTRDDDDLKVTNLAHVRLYLAYCLNLRRSGRRETMSGVAREN